MAVDSGSETAIVMTWSNGRHAYYGKDNGRGKRGMSKVMKGIKVDKKAITKAFKAIEYEGEGHANTVREEESAHRSV